MSEIGSEGVLVLISESTNAERPGLTPSEKLVGSHIEDAFYMPSAKSLSLLSLLMLIAYSKL